MWNNVYWNIIAQLYKDAVRSWLGRWSPMGLEKRRTGKQALGEGMCF